jgi:hypothetical protein
LRWLRKWLREVAEPKRKVVRIRIFGVDESADIEGFVSLERAHIVVADLRRRLPSFERQLQRDYPGIRVRIDYRLPRFKNPIEPSVALIAAGAVGLGLSFWGSFAHGFGKHLGEASGKAVETRIRSWVRKLDKMNRTMRRKRPKRAKRMKSRR